MSPSYLGWLLLASSYLATAVPTTYDRVTVSSNRFVTAHYLVGNAAQYTIGDWRDDMLRAQAAGIDAFGLNIAYGDPNTLTSLSTAFKAAESLTNRTIQLYLNFDYLAWGVWPSSSVIELINTYKSSPAYFLYLSRPLVTTFEGTSNIDDWPSIRTATDCYFMPDWSSLGPSGALSHLSVVDGLSSWSAWPDGPTNLTTELDETYISGLDGKPYMFPLSPFFYTNVPTYNKNWLWNSDSLFHYRWLQALELSPTFIQIISWNDYGESHYIGPIRPSGIPSGADLYVDSTTHSHSAWLKLLPSYISAYKLSTSLTTPPPSGEDTLVYWYKTTPSLTTSPTQWNGTTGNNPSYQPTYPPTELSPDKIFFTVVLTAPAIVEVCIGTGTQLRQVQTAGLSHFSIPVPKNRRGRVVFTVFRDGETVMEVNGPEIERSEGWVNWNVAVGSS